MSTIALALAGNVATIKPLSFLGGDLFAAYRAALEGARFDGATKCYRAPLDKLPRILSRLRDAGFSLALDPALVEALKGHEAQAEAHMVKASTRLDAIDTALAARGHALFPFQREGVTWLAGRTGALLADEMGLGKTVQALAALPEGAPIVVVAPAIAKGVWAREAAKWRPDLKVSILAGRGSFRWPAPGEMVVLNYDILPDAADPCPEGTCLIADEAHALKNFKAKRTQKFRALSENVRARGGKTWLLTATPLLNRPTELWGILSAAGLEREVFGSWGQFMQLFDAYKDKWGGMHFGTPALSVPSRLARVSLRRMRVEVLPELPVKTWQTIEVEISATLARKCEALVAKLADAGITLESLDEKITRTRLTFEDFSEVRQALAVAKIPTMLALVEEYEAQDEPLVVFSAHRMPIDALATREGWAVITGDTSPEARTAIEDRFQRGELRGVGATIQAGGVAITLTRSANALFVDRDWTPALNSQAEDRICRIGQDRGCQITTLVAAHAIDRRVADLLTVKTALAVATLPTQGTASEGAFASVTSYVSTPSTNGTPSAIVPEAPERTRTLAQSAEEAWAFEALQTLAGHDSDFASMRNGVGFNKLDGDFGHSLAEQARTRGLTPKQWAAAVRLCRKYTRQVGSCP